MCEIAHRWYSQTLFTRKSTIFLVVDVVYYFAFLCSQYRLFFLFMIFLIRSHTLLRLAFVSRNFLCSLILLMFILSIQCHDILMLLLPSTLHFVPITFFFNSKIASRNSFYKEKTCWMCAKFILHFHSIICSSIAFFRDRFWSTMTMMMQISVFIMGFYRVQNAISISIVAAWTFLLVFFSYQILF